MVLSETHIRVTDVACRFFWSSEGACGWASASAWTAWPGRTDLLRLTLEPSSRIDRDHRRESPTLDDRHLVRAFMSLASSASSDPRALLSSIGAA
jgi:hypothetical protein